MSAAADALMGIFGFRRVEGEGMKTIEQTRRELFEVWLLKHKPIVAADMLEEGSFVPEWMFESWCAALESVFIELPILIEPEPPEDAFDDSWRDGYAAADRYRNKCRAAIEKTGLGIRVI